MRLQQRQSITGKLDRQVQAAFPLPRDEMQGTRRSHSRRAANRPVGADVAEEADGKTREVGLAVAGTPRAGSGNPGHYSVRQSEDGQAGSILYVACAKMMMSMQQMV